MVLFGRDDLGHQPIVADTGLRPAALYILAARQSQKSALGLEASRFSLGLARPRVWHCLAVALLATTEALAQNCAFSRLSSTTLLTSSGHDATVNLTAAVRSGQEILLLGSPTHLWTGQANIEPAPSPPTELIGLVRGVGGDWSTVSSPPGIGRTWLARAAPRAEGGWHVLLVSDSGDRRRVLQEGAARAHLWYAHFTAGRWSAPRSLGTADSSLASDRTSSSLTPWKGLLAFAYPIAMPGQEATPSSGGIALVLVDPLASWSSDTLLTWQPPSRVDLAVDAARGRLLVVSGGAYFANQRVWPSTVFLTPYDGRWGMTHRIASDAENAKTPLEIVETEFGAFLAVRTNTGEEQSGRRLDVISLLSPSRASRRIELQSVPLGVGIAGAPAPEGSVWVIPDPSEPTRLHGHLVTESGSDDLGFVDAPFENLRPALISLDTLRYLLVTGTRHGDRGELRPRMLLTELQLRCAGASTHNVNTPQ